MPDAILETVITDSSVLINFLKIGRLDLMLEFPGNFYITDHVYSEITNFYPEQRELLDEAIQLGAISMINVTEPHDLELFRELKLNGRLGAGECSAIAFAVNRRLAIAIDDKRAINEIRARSETTRVLQTQDIMIEVIRQGKLAVTEADSIMQEWRASHKFHLNIQSFQDLF